MKASKNCQVIIKGFEGYHTKLSDGWCQAYPDPLNGTPWTIGWGSTVNKDTGDKVKQGLIINEVTAQRWLDIEVEECAAGLQKMFPDFPFNQNQLDALTSFAFNLGLGGIGEDLTAAIKAKDIPDIVYNMKRYINKGTNVEAGLTDRRKQETDLFLKPMNDVPINVDDSVTWLDIFRRDDKGTFGLAAMAADKCIAVYEGSGTEFLVSFIKRFKNAKNCLVAPASKPWHGDFKKPEPPTPKPTGIVTYKKGEDVWLSKNFHLSEYECKCSRCQYTKVDMNHVARLQQARDEIGLAISTTSAYRCPAHNLEVGGVTDSQHVDGTATDIYCEGITATELAKVCSRIFDGVGLYVSQGFVHADSRGYKAYWEG